MSGFRRPSSDVNSSTRSTTLKFPDFNHDTVLSPTSPRVTNFALPPPTSTTDEQRWYPAPNRNRPSNTSSWPPNTKRGRQKSLSEAIKTIKDRRGSVVENAVEVAEALKAPVSPKLVVSTGGSVHGDHQLTTRRHSAVYGTQCPSSPPPLRKLFSPPFATQSRSPLSNSPSSRLSA